MTSIENGFNDIDEPDLSLWELGKWDDCDIVCNSYKLNVKSTKHFGNLLMLSKKDWDSKGNYIPNIDSGNSLYDYFILTRIAPNGEGLMRQNLLLYSNQIDMGKSFLYDLILNQNWSFDIAGYIDITGLRHAIDHNFILPKWSKLNGKIRINAPCYYIQSGDMNNYNSLLTELRK